MKNATRLRLERGWSLGEVARTISVDRATISRFESMPGREMRHAKLAALAQLYNVTIDELLGGHER